MGPKKDLVPHVERSVAFLTDNPFKFGQSGDLLKHQSTWRSVKTINRQFVPSLLNGWQTKVLAAVPSFSTADLATIEVLTNDYVAERVVRLTNPIEWKGIIARVDRISDCSKALLDELNDWGLDYSLIWRRLEQISQLGGRKPLQHDDVYPIVSSLYSAASAAAIQMRSDYQISGSLSHQKPWQDFVRRLGEVAERVGVRVTVAKNVRASYAKPSPFANLAWVILTEAIPQPLREHVSSRGAMQAALSKALPKRDRSSKINKRKNPARKR
jgi:hypothetical protein